MMKKLIPQDLNPETMKKYLADLRTLENSIKAGYKEGKWYPHSSFEGGMPTIGYGHKVIQGEDFSKGLTEKEAVALQKKDVLKAQNKAKDFIDKKYGKGTFNKMPQNSQMLAIDYAYNVGLSKFPSFTEALVKQDKPKMLKEFKRFSGNTPLKERNTWTKGVIEEFEKGGSFSNDGFKSLPLPIQQQIMKGANKKELGGADTVDPTEVARLMKQLNSEYASTTNINRQNTNFKADPNETVYASGSPEYDATYKQMLNNILAGNPTDTYGDWGGREYSRENVYAAYMANPPKEFITSSQFSSPIPIFDTPPTMSNVTLQQMPTPPVQTVAPKEYKVLGSYGQELPWIEEYGVQGMHPYKETPLVADFQFSQHINEANYKKELEARSFLTEDEITKAAEEGLTAIQYTQKYRPKREDIKVAKLPEGGFKYGGNMYAGGGNMYPNGSTLGTAAYPSMYMGASPLGTLNPKEQELLDLGINPNPNTDAGIATIRQRKGAPATWMEDSMYKDYSESIKKDMANTGVYARGGMMNQYAMGAQMPQGQMTDIPTTEFNAGGSHEANAMGGVYQGMASNGKPNLVEQGELKITIPGTDEQFIVSPKIKLDKTTAEEFGLNKKHVGKDMVKIFKGLLRKNNFAEREGDSIVENSKQLEIMPYVAAHQKLTEIANAKDQAKKQEAFDKDMTQMMEKHPEYMEALMAQSQQPMQQQGPSPEEMAMMQAGPQGAMPPMMANGGNMYKMGGYEIADKALNVVGTAVGSVPLGWTNAVGAALSGIGSGLGQIGEQKDLYESTGERMGFSDIDWGAVGIDAAAGAGKGATGAIGSIAIGAAGNVAQEAYKSKAELEAEKFQQMLANNPNSPEAQQRLADAEKYTGKEINPYAEMGTNVGMMALEKGAQMGAEKITENLAENALETGIGMVARYGGKQYSTGSFLENKMMEGYNTTLDNETDPTKFDTSLEEGVKEVNVEGGWGSSLMQLAPLVTSGITAFSKPETYNAGDLGYKATTAPKISYREAKELAKQQATSAAKDIKNVGGAGYLGNRIANALNASRALAEISQQEENVNKQLSYQNALQNAGRYQQAAGQSALLTAQALAAKQKALQDFGITVGSLGSKFASDQLGAGYADMASEDIAFRYNPIGRSFLGKATTNKTEKSKRKSKRKSND